VNKYKYIYIYIYYSLAFADGNTVRGTLLLRTSLTVEFADPVRLLTLLIPTQLHLFLISCLHTVRSNFSSCFTKRVPPWRMPSSWLVFRVALVRTDVNDVPSSPILVTLMVEAVASSETSVLRRATRRNVPEDGILHGYRPWKSKILYRINRLSSLAET
jgi:hypothetical protein